MSDDERHTTNGGLSGIINGMPMWFQAAWLVAMTFGVPVLMVGYYLARDAGYINNPIEEELETMNRTILQHDATMVQFTTILNNQVQLLNADREDRRYRCVMGAKTDEAKRNCFPKQPPPSE